MSVSDRAELYRGAPASGDVLAPRGRDTCANGGAGLVALVTLLGLACTDPVPPVTAPPQHRTPSIPRTPPGVAATYDPVPGGTVTLPLGDSVTAQASAALPYFQHTTLVRVTITGSLTTRLTPFNDGNPNSPQAPGAPRTFGPEGYYWGSSQVNGCGAGVYVAWVLGEGRWPACAPDGSTDGTGTVVTHLYARDHGSAVRTAVALGTSGPNDCFYYAPDFFSGYGPCFYYATPGQQVSVERVRAEASLEVVTPLPVLAGDSVTFVAAVTPEVVDNKALNNSVSGWEWTPEGGTPTPVCTAAATWTCRIAVTKPGTMKVVGYANGEPFERSAPALVMRPTVVLTPSPAHGMVGERLTFNVAVQPPNKPNGEPIPWQVTDWRWQSPDGWNGYACREPPFPTSCSNPWTLVTQHTGSRVTVRVTVNTVADSATSLVQVFSEAELHLIATPSSIDDMGDTVHFAARLYPDTPASRQIPWAVTSWTWEMDGADGGVSAFAGSAAFVEKNRQASPRGGTGAPLPGRARVFRPRVLLSAEVPDSLADTTLNAVDDDMTPGGLAPWTVACSHTSPDCTIPVFEAGTMTVTATIDGRDATASAPVTIQWIYECPPIATGPSDTFVIDSRTWLVAKGVGPFVGKYLYKIVPPVFWTGQVLKDTLNGQIPIGKYVPTGGYTTGGHVMKAGYMRYMCRTRRKQNADGSVFWQGTTRLVGWNLFFGPPDPQ